MNKAKQLIELVEEERYRLGRKGQGGFLNPPGHPEHDWSVELGSGRGRDPYGRGSMSLTHALKQSDVDDETKKRIQDLLDRWEKSKPSLSDPKIQDWVRQVMGYFKGGYEDKGVEFIKKYYPEFELTPEITAQAYWGTKKESYE